jgi:ATP-binding cassette subfamily C protein LapB
MTEIAPSSPAPAAVRDAEAPSAEQSAPPDRVEALGCSAGDWRIRQPDTATDDPLLGSLVALTHLLERPSSAKALTAGLPLVDGLLTPDLFPRAAERAGLSARLLRRSLESIDDLVLPCVLLLRNRRAAVLVRRLANDRFELLLPEVGSGTVEIGGEELRSKYAGYAFFAKPVANFLRRDCELRETASGHWFWSTILSQWPIYGEVLLASVLINCFAIATSLFAMNVYDRVVPNNALETLWVLTVGIIIVLCFDFLLKMLRGYFVDTAGKIADIKMASTIFEHVLQIRMSDRPRSAGAFASNLREFETLRDFFTSATMTTLVDLPFLLLFVAAIWAIGGVVAVVPLAGIPIVIGAGLLLQIPLNRVIRRTFREASQKHGVLVEAINGLETIKSIGAEGRMQRAWEALVSATAESANKSRLLSAFTVNLANLVGNTVYVGVVVVGVYEIAAGRLTTGGLIACSILAGRAMAPLGQVAAVLTRYHQARTSLDTLNGIMQLPSERPAERIFVHRPVLKGAIEFKSVSFSYPGQKLPALSDVSFRIAPGERVGLIGRIGSGKSTIEKLVLGLYQPDTGAVLVDGIDIRQIDPADLRRNIGCVPQDVVLFQGSIRENITLGAPFVDDAAVLRAAFVAGVEDFVGRHPAGYDLNVGERGEALSGGQRQAVAIARALLLDPPVLVLDEPTSAMDNGAESRFIQRIARELPGRTLLLVTHRASLLALVERLIVMDGGRVVADGPKDKVLKALATGQIRGDT